MSRVLGIGLVLAVMSRFAFGETPESRTIRIAYTQFPPIEYQDENGQAAGSLIEMTRKVAREAGYEPEFVLLPISRIYLYLQNGNVDLWPGLTDIPALEGEVLESWVSPLVTQLSAWYLEGTAPLEHFDQLNGKTVIAIGGYTYAGLIQWLSGSDSIRVTEAPNHRAAIDMLRRGRGDYVLDYHDPVQVLLNTMPDHNVRESKIRERDAAWLFSLAAPRAAILRDAFDDAYLRLVERDEVPPVRIVGPGYAIPGFPAAYR